MWNTPDCRPLRNRARCRCCPHRWAYLRYLEASTSDRLFHWDGSPACPRLQPSKTALCSLGMNIEGPSGPEPDCNRAGRVWIEPVKQPQTAAISFASGVLAKDRQTINGMVKALSTLSKILVRSVRTGGADTTLECSKLSCVCRHRSCRCLLVLSCRRIVHRLRPASCVPAVAFATASSRVQGLASI
jgi:hypothetical protein